MRRTTALFLVALTVLAALAGATPARAGVEAVSGGIRFTYSDPYANTVALAGDFNGWNMSANPMTLENGVWSVTVSLPPGQHEYKFVVDSQWTADPDNPVTLGDFGNSAVEVGPDGKLVQMKATSNTELSPKIYLGSRYITLFQLRKNEAATTSWDLERPDFDIDLDYTIRMNEALTAHVLTKINNVNQNVQLWETNLVFDRGSLLVDTPDIRLMAYDNDSLGTFDDPLTLLGGVGIYRHAWGYNQQGISAWKSWKGFDAQIVYSDDFRTGGTSSGGTVSTGWTANDSVFTGVHAPSYVFSDSDNAKDVLGFRVKRNLAAGLRGGMSYRLDRGANPGILALSEMSRDRRSVTQSTFDKTREYWQAGGADLIYVNDPAGIDLTGEFLVGENWIRTGSGTGSVDAFTTGGNISSSDLPSVTTRDVRLDTSHRLLLGAHYYAYRGWHWRAGFEFEDHDLSPVANDSLRAFYSRVATWSLDLSFDGEEWKAWPWEAGLGVTVNNFLYASDAPWNTQIWFDYRNFWLEQGEHDVTVDRLVMLGGGDVVTWRPRARWTFEKRHNGTLRYDGILNTTKIGRKPKYWENDVQFHWEFDRRLELNTDSRWVRYDDPVLKLDDTFLSHFVEFKYKFTPAVEVGLSWGVDPIVIDPITNEYAHHGRDYFLFDRGANGSTARDRYLELGDIIARAEKQLEDENVFQLEAIVRF